MKSILGSVENEVRVVIVVTRVFPLLSKLYPYNFFISLITALITIGSAFACNCFSLSWISKQTHQPVCKHHWNLLSSNAIPFSWPGWSIQANGSSNWPRLKEKKFDEVSGDSCVSTA
jgi:hypothetical protein